MSSSSLARSILLTLVAAYSSGCGGGGSPTAPARAPVTFIAESGGASTSLSLQDAGVGRDGVILELRGEGVQGLSSVVFGLIYPASLLRLERIEQGDLILGALTIVDFLGLTQIIDFGLPSGSASGTVLRLVLTPIGNGSGTIAFDQPQANDSQGTAIDVDWRGGRIEIDGL